MKFFQSVKAFCAAEFTTYVRCIESTNERQEIHQCRKTQYAFDACIKNNLGYDRPSYAYNTLAKIHDTDRPKPEEPRPTWLDDPRGAYGRPDVLPDAFPRGKKPYGGFAGFDGTSSGVGFGGGAE